MSSALIIHDRLPSMSGEVALPSPSLLGGPCQKYNGDTGANNTNGRGKG